MNDFSAVFEALTKIQLHRFHGPDENQQDREESETPTSGILNLLGAFVISEYIPSWWSIAKLQG